MADVKIVLSMQVNGEDKADTEFVVHKEDNVSVDKMIHGFDFWMSGVRIAVVRILREADGGGRRETEQG